jgi:hypothetical protein
VPLVAFEGDAIDDRVFDHGHDQPAARLVDAHVLEQAGGVERLERLVDLVAVEPLARIEPEIGADGLRLDAAVAFDDDGRGLGDRIAGRAHRGGRSAKNDPCEDRARPAQVPKQPHANPHAQRALFHPNRPNGDIADPTQHHVCTGFFPLRNTTGCRVSPISSRNCSPTGHFPKTVARKAQLYDAQSRGSS